MSNIKIPARISDAWQQAWRMRCCPPDTVLAGILSEELKQHLEICPSCRRERADPLPEIRLNFPSKSPAQSLPRVGELWSIAGKTAGWGPKSRYYSPPVILVTAVLDNRAVNVIQISADTELAGEDDILLDNGIIGFAEVWNRYTLHIEVLENVLGKISTALLNRIEKAPAEHDVRPSPGSLLWFFRQMEVETGCFFARQSIADLLASDDALSPPALLYTSPEELLDDLKNLPVIIPDTCLDCSFEHILANTGPADELLPMAAAELEPENIGILIYTARQGRIQSVRMVPGRVNLQYEQDSFLHVSGLCESCPDQNCEWLFRYHTGKLSLEPLPGQYGAENGVFWAVFPAEDVSEPFQGELIVRIIHHQ
jgi:hypothetical protein